MREASQEWVHERHTLSAYPGIAQPVQIPTLHQQLRTFLNILEGSRDIVVASDRPNSAIYCLG